MSKSFAKKDIPFCHNMILRTIPSEGLRTEQAVFVYRQTCLLREKSSPNPPLSHPCRMDSASFGRLSYERSVSEWVRSFLSCGSNALRLACTVKSSCLVFFAAAYSPISSRRWDLS